MSPPYCSQSNLGKLVLYMQFNNFYDSASKMFDMFKYGCSLDLWWARNLLRAMQASSAKWVVELN